MKKVDMRILKIKYFLSEPAKPIEQRQMYDRKILKAIGSKCF